MVYCNSQDEIDHYREKFTDGGAEIQCGWLKDRYGFSWHINTTALNELFSSDDPAKSERVMSALLKMKKLDIETLRNA
jgi:predicted 3-demethylubiquinone-9 3-methyltransferase (glyoxalase superfamily)